MINTNSVIEKGSIIDIGAIVDHDTFVGFACQIDCVAIVKAHSFVIANTKVESKKVITREDMRSLKDFLEANGF